MTDIAKRIAEMYGPTVTMDRHGNMKQKKARIQHGRKSNEPAGSQKQVDRVQPLGQPLEPWGDKEVVITPEDVAQAIREFDERVPEAAGLLVAESSG